MQRNLNITPVVDKIQAQNINWMQDVNRNARQQIHQNKKKSYTPKGQKEA
jgi:hypothetical protein